MVQIESSEQPFALRESAGLAGIEQAVLATQRLMKAGAIMTQPGPCPENHLVGYLEWLEPQRLFWFTAYGETPVDGHVLEFDAVHVVAERGIHFYHSGQLVASLTAIEHAKVEDPDDYRIAWQLWQEVAPLRRRMIEACCGALVRGAVAENVLDGQPAARVGPVTAVAKPKRGARA